MGETAFVVKMQIKSPPVRKALAQIVGAQPWLRIQGPEDGRRPDLLIFELGTQPEDDFPRIQSLMDMDAVDEVFLTSENLSQEVLLRALRAGAKEFFSQPINEEEVHQALAQFKRRKDEPRQRQRKRAGRVAYVIGSKGGIGSTTIAVNLAVALAANGRAESVALMDMSMPFGEAPLFLEIAPRFHWGEAVKNSNRLDDSFLMNILVRHSSGVHVLPSPASADSFDSRTPETLERLVGLMRRMFDFLIIDGGRSLDGLSLRLVDLSDIILLVSVLSLPCLTNTQKVLSILNNLHHPPRERAKVIINRYLRNSEISLKDARVSLHQDVYWTLPNDYRTTMSAIHQGKALSQIAPKAPITKSLRDLAGALFEPQAQPEKGL